MQKWKNPGKSSPDHLMFSLYHYIGGIPRQFFENPWIWLLPCSFQLLIRSHSHAGPWIWLFHYGIGAIPTFASLWIWGSASLAGLQCTVINRPICKEMSAPARCWSQSFCIPFFLCPALCWRNDQCLQKHEMHFKIQGCSVQALDLEVHKL